MATLSLLPLLLLGCLVPKPELVQQLDREVIALRTKNTVLQEQLDACGGGEIDSDLYSQLVSIFADLEAEVSREGQRAIVVIPGEFLFSPGQTSIREEAMMMMDLLATALNIHSATHVWIIGHTDDQPLSGSLKRKHGDNWGLSTARAQSFMRQLVDSFGVEAHRFTIAGQGPSNPIVPNDTSEGREKNRRIVVVVGPPELHR